MFTCVCSPHFAHILQETPVPYHSCAEQHGSILESKMCRPLIWPWHHPKWGFGGLAYHIHSWGFSLESRLSDCSNSYSGFQLLSHTIQHLHKTAEKDCLGWGVISICHQFRLSFPSVPYRSSGGSEPVSELQVDKYFKKTESQPIRGIQVVLLRRRAFWNLDI